MNAGRKASRLPGLLVASVLLGALLMAGGTARAGLWTTGVVDSVDDVGEYSDLALNASGSPRVAYYDYSTDEVKYAEWTGSAWTTAVVGYAGPNGYAGSSVGLALNRTDSPKITYYYSDSAGVGELRYAQWTGTAWAVETVDSSGDVGMYSHIALDASDHPRIAYYDGANQSVKYAEWTGTAWTTGAVAAAGVYGYWGYSTDIALDASGSPRISYYFSDSADSGQLQYAAWTGASWSLTTVDSAGDVGEFSHIALDAGGNPRIAYYDFLADNVKYAEWTGASWTRRIVGSTGGSAAFSAGSVGIALDASGRPHVSYYYSSGTALGELRCAKWTGTAWATATVDQGGDVGWDSAIAVDASGYARVSYYDYTNGDLKYASESPALPPSAPRALSALGGDGQVQLVWAAPQDDGGSPVFAYSVYRGAAAGGEAFLTNVTTTGFMDTGVTNGETYFYQVSAWNDAGESPRAAEVSAVPAGPPGAPLQVAATAGDGQVSLSWSAPASDGGRPVTSYRVYRGTAPTGLSMLAIVPGTTTYTDPQVENGRTYYYMVTAQNAAGEGPGSAVVSATPSAPLYAQPWLWGLIIAIVVVALLALLLARRRKRAPAPPAEPVPQGAAPFPPYTGYAPAAPPTGPVGPAYPPPVAPAPPPPPPAGASPRPCPACGRPLEADARFCGACGTRVP